MSELSDFTNDPSLTAFALGELEGAERAEVEAIVAKDEAARKAVEEIRATAGVLASELSRVGGAALTAEQRAKIAAKAEEGEHVLRVRPVLRLQPWHWVAAAASVATVIGVVVLSENREAKESESARLDGGKYENLTRLGNSSASVQTEARFEDEEARDTLTVAPPEVVDRAAIPKYVENQQDGPIDPDEVIIPDAAPGRRGEITDNTDPGKEPGEFNPDPEAPANVPSGATGGTSIGVGAGAAAGKAPAPFFAGRGKGAQRNGGGAGGGGLGQRGGGGAAPPRGAAARAPGGNIDDAERLKSLGYVGGDRSGSAESYSHINDNPFRLVKDAPLSTFGIDVDTASYSNVRRMLNEGRLPPPGAVRIEEMVNYFPYSYAPPTDGRPFAVRVDVAGCPWKTDHRLVRVGLKGRVVESAARPASNLVFLIDVSGSMNEPAKLPLLVQSMKLMVEKLESRDRVAMVVYAGSSGLVLPSTSCTEKAVILSALDRLQAGGSTNGGAGIQLAYETAVANKIDGGVNRVILATDGDFNVGVTDESSLVRLIEEKAKSGVFLSVLGFGTGNYKDSQMEKLADRGNGNYAYVDTLKEGQKALVEQMNGTLVTIAKDVKLQLEFNPGQVGAWRLIGYENRVLAAEDFKDDKKDAGEIGAGHTVTALYEVVPPGVLATETIGVDPLKYQQPPRAEGSQSRELLTVKLRWKEPNSDVSTPMEVPVIDEGMTYSSASADFKFAASVAAFGMCLRGSPHRGQANIDAILELATEGLANDPGDYRKQFIELVSAAKRLGTK